jgi:hypothetical protein
MTEPEFEDIRASARLPHLDIDIQHRRARDGGAEQISISLQATPSFHAFGEFLAANPFAFWARLAYVAWLPWLNATQGLSSPSGLAAIPSTAPSESLTKQSRSGAGTSSAGRTSKGR